MNLLIVNETTFTKKSLIPYHGHDKKEKTLLIILDKDHKVTTMAPLFLLNKKTIGSMDGTIHYKI